MLKGESPPNSFPQTMMMNQTVWYTPGGIRSHIISMMTSFKKITADKSKETRVFDTIAQSGSSNFYQLVEADKTATRQQIVSLHKMNVMMHPGRNPGDSMFALFMSSFMPGLMQVPPLDTIGRFEGYFNLLGRRCEKRLISEGKGKKAANMTVWITRIAGRTVLMRITLRSHENPVLLLDSLSVQVVKTPAHFVELPVGYTIKEAD